MLSAVNSGDTAWMLVCTALVFLMIPGFAFFYGGLLHKKNPLSILLPCLLAACLVSLQWILVGYSLTFGPDHNGWIGTLAWVGLRGVSAEPNLEYAGTVPHPAFVVYQAMLAAVAVVILIGAFAERMKLSALCVFAVLWTTLVYDPVAHWIWGVGGFLRGSDAIDFAGGAVVHLNAGVSALAAALMLERSDDSSSVGSYSTNLLFAVLGGVLIWFGWFGLNTGSAVSAGPVAASAFLATYVSSVAGGLAWAMLDGIINKQSTLLGLITGAVAGLVAVAPAAGSVSVWGAAGIGFGISILCYGVFLFIEKKIRFGDSLLAFGVHGVGGMLGMLAVGHLLIQIKAALAIVIYSFGMTYLILKVIDYIVGLRQTEPIGPSET